MDFATGPCPHRVPQSVTERSACSSEAVDVYGSPLGPTISGVKPLASSCAQNRHVCASAVFQTLCIDLPHCASLQARLRTGE